MPIAAVSQAYLIHTAELKIGVAVVAKLHQRFDLWFVTR
jgi:hypothetical protein